jgi:hypothetical protein
MILPHPESDLSLNVMVMASDIASILAKRPGFVFEETLMKEFVKLDSRRSPDMFVDCLTFLYAFDYLERTGHRIRLKESALRKVGLNQLRLFDHA